MIIQSAWVTVTQETLFADDSALLVHKDSSLWLMLNKFLEAAMLLSLIISLNKTEVVH